MESINEIEYKVNDLPTRSVVLFPTRAQVCRELKDVDLKPGLNEITISGLTPTLDEDSVKVEGSGSAIITNISVESLPNRDIFEDVYPESDSESESEEDDANDSDDDSAELKTAKEDLKALRDELSVANEEVANAEKRLAILNAYSGTLDGKKQEVDMQKYLKEYKLERETAFADNISGSKKKRDIQKKVDEAQKQVRKLQTAEAKIRAKAEKIKQKEQSKRDKRRAEQRKEKNRIKTEREWFWPKYCYSVRITLDVNTMTPLSSRRNSISSEVEVPQPLSPSKHSDGEFEDASQSQSCNLVLTYATTSAWWAPSYDLQLSTTKATASLCFDAELRNKTSETWKNCKITLSTSEASFSGIDSNIPKLVPWNIRLAGKHEAHRFNESSITRSREEFFNREQWTNAQKKHVVEQKPRFQMFGVDHSSTNAWSGRRAGRGGGLFGSSQPAQTSTSAFGAQSTDTSQAQEHRRARGGFGNSAVDLFGGSGGPIPPPPPAPAAAAAAVAAPGAGLFGSAAPNTNPFANQAAAATERGEALDSFRKADEVDYDGATFKPDIPEEAVDFEESLVEATGLTTTYDLPGLKTLAPKSTSSKQRVARVNFPSVTLSHTVVAKYKPLAYLKAKLKNSSKLTLIEGPTGLTLDGTFMGRTKIPRCSSGDIFSLSLGVDPAIKVSYPKPEVRRATTGILSRENSSVYARAVVLHNTRATSGKPAKLLILDQVPVSQDEKLRVSLVTPNGLVVDGGSVATGLPTREFDRDKDWGKAGARLKEGGELNWDVTLNPGKSVKLWLEYAVAMPVAETAVQC